MSSQITTNYKYIRFKLAEQKPKTLVYDILNNNSDDLIGQVKYYAQWRQYIFFPQEGCIFSVGCLDDIIDFTKKVQANHRTLNKQKKLDQFEDIQ